MKLSNVANDTEIRLDLPAEKTGYATFFRRKVAAFANDASELNRDVLLSVSPRGVGLRSVSLLFRDSAGEVFQLKQPVQIPQEQWGTVRFHAGDVLGKSVIVHRGGNGVIDFPLSLLGFNFDHEPTAAKPASILVRDLEVARPLGLWRLADWNAYGEGFRIEGVNEAQTQLRINRAATGRSYVSLVSRVRPLLADSPSQWPQQIEIGYRDLGAPVSAVSLLVIDAGGETFQLKQTVQNAGGAWQTVRFPTAAFPEQKGLIIYGGDGNKQIDYPVRLFGFNFDFARKEEPVQLFVTPPVIGDADSTPTQSLPAGAGGGAANMD